MKILLIKPEYVSGSDIIVPRTLALMGAVIKKSGHDVGIFDFNVMDNFPEFLESFKPDVVGISCSTPTIRDALKAAHEVKKYDKSVYVIFGGIHPTALPEKTLKDKNIDVVVRGESEETMPELLKAIKTGKLSSVKGITYMSKGNIHNTPDRPLVENLDDIPNPDYDIIPMEKYTRAYMMTSRGCPFQCVFCGSHLLFGHRVRFRGAERVVDEMKDLKKRNFDYVWVTDDTFTLNKKRVHDVCDEIIRRKLKMDWTCLTRVNTVDVKMLKKMKKAGCSRVNFGIESTDPVVIKAIKKSITLEDIKKAFKISRKAKMETAAYLMVGLPKQTWKSVLHTNEVLKIIKPNVTWVNVLVPYPDTEVYMNMKTRGMLKDEGQLWEEYRLYTPDGKKSPNILKLDEKISGMSGDEIVKAYELLTATGRRISINYKIRSPRYILSALFRIRSLGDFKERIKQVKRFLKS